MVTTAHNMKTHITLQ